mmetsp:Transcript_83527/g.233079  ORF Transcript_83527/g.233079 Transcript_83527/m.233079 type:complete len:273 (-) Transcript_83527:633-1451(-)
MSRRPSRTERSRRLTSASGVMNTCTWTSKSCRWSCAGTTPPTRRLCGASSLRAIALRPLGTRRATSSSSRSPNTCAGITTDGGGPSFSITLSVWCTRITVCTWLGWVTRVSWARPRSETASSSASPLWCAALTATSQSSCPTPASLCRTWSLATSTAYAKNSSTSVASVARAPGAEMNRTLRPPTSSARPSSRKVGGSCSAFLRGRWIVVPTSASTRSALAPTGRRSTTVRLRCGRKAARRCGSPMAWTTPTHSYVVTKCWSTHRRRRCSAP